MYSAQRLNKQGDNIKPWHTPFPILNQSIFACPVLTVASWLANRFLRRQVRWSLFGIVNEAEIDVFLESLCFLYDPKNLGNLISVSSAFSKSSLYIWKFLGHILLKANSKDFEHYLASMWNECNCMVIWTLFGIVLLWDFDENDLLQCCGHCWILQICWHIECTLSQHHLLGL